MLILEDDWRVCVCVHVCAHMQAYMCVCVCVLSALSHPTYVATDTAYRQNHKDLT